MTTQQTDKEILFAEVQAFRQLWLWAFLLGIVSVQAACFLREMMSLTPALIFFAAWGAALFFLYILKLDVKVDDDYLHVRFWPLLNKHIPLADIAQFEVRGIGQFGNMAAGACVTPRGAAPPTTSAATAACNWYSPMESES